MDKNLYFDHSFTVDQNHKFLKKLIKLGFTANPDTWNHPGGAVCRHIMFASKNPVKKNYLEFVHNAGKKPKYKTPGFSFGYTKGLKKLNEKLVASGKIKTKFVHRNYDWKKGDNEYRPGWNFVTFKNSGVNSIYPWITEYEKPKGWSPKKRKPAPIHRNKIKSIAGFEFEINAKGEKFFELMCGRKEEAVLTFGPGFKLYFESGKKTKIKNVILKSDNIKAFIKKHKLKQTSFRGKPATIIKNPNPDMWSIIVI